MSWNAHVGHDSVIGKNSFLAVAHVFWVNVKFPIMFLWEQML